MFPNLPNPDRIAQIMGDVVHSCLTKRVNFIMKADRYVDYNGTACNGYFVEHDDKPGGTLAISTDKPFDQWMALLLHEASHMDQWAEGNQYWLDIRLGNGESTDVLFAWTEETDPVKIAQYEKDYDIRDLAERSLRVELDCERRTLAKIRHYGLDPYINPVDYVKKANAYIYFYLYMLECRSFYKKDKEPYTVQEVWSIAPDTFANDYSRIPDDLLAAFRKYL